MDELQRFADVLERMAKELRGDEKKAAVGAMMAQRLHGIGGLFSGSGLDQVVFHTYVRPQSILNDLPLLPSVIEDPRFAALTGFTAPDGSQPSHACQDAPSGFAKSCTLTAMFGLKRFDTQEIEMDQVMRRANRGDFGDLRLINQILGPLAEEAFPGGVTRDNVLNVVTLMEMMRASAYMEMGLHTDAWQGTVAAGSFPGLASQIATGQVDAATNTACPSLDSDVKDFACNDVCGSAMDIVDYLSSLLYYLDNLAMDTGMAPVTHKLYMRPQLWHELTNCWPCRYNTFSCTVRDTANIDAVPSIDATDMTAQRDQIRRSLQLPINGKMYDVGLDTGIYEHTVTTNGCLNPGEYSSNIYVVPLTVIGNWPVTYREYVDYKQAAPDEALLRGMNQWFHTDDGAYSWSYNALRWCYIMSLKTEQRVVLRTPHLAGTLQNIKYSPLQHVREPDYDSPYHVDGGISLPSTSTRYAVWASSGVSGR